MPSPASGTPGLIELLFLDIRTRFMSGFGVGNGARPTALRCPINWDTSERPSRSLWVWRLGARRALTTPWFPVRAALDRVGRIRTRETGATGIGVSQFEKRVRALLVP